MTKEASRWCIQFWFVSAKEETAQDYHWYAFRVESWMKCSTRTHSDALML